MEPLDQDNPAVSRQVQVSPAMLEAVEKDPSFLKGLSRKLLLVHINTVHHMLRNKDISARTRMDFIELLAKLGDAIPKPAAVGAGGPGSGFSVQIVLTGKQQTSDVVEVQATPVVGDGS